MTTHYTYTTRPTPQIGTMGGLLKIIRETQVEWEWQTVRQVVEFRVAANRIPCPQCGHVMQINCAGNAIIVCPHQMGEISKVTREAREMEPVGIMGIQVFVQQLDHHFAGIVA